MNLIETALTYRNQYDLSIIPCRKDKKPYVPWQEFQKRTATKEEILNWWTQFPDANIGIVTGIVSHLAVIDIDTEEGEKNVIPFLHENNSFDTPKVSTPRGGKHLYYYCDDTTLNNNAGLIKGCDLRANGGYVLAPPSMNDAGKQYSWISEFDPQKLKTLPKAYYAYLQSLTMYKKDIHISNNACNDSCNVTSELFQSGRRDEDLFHIANQLAKARTPKHEIEQVLALLAKGCNPPFPLSEMKAKVESAIKRIECKDVNLTELAESFIQSADGIFSLQECYQYVTDCYPSLQNVTNRNSLRVIMKRFKDQGLIAGTDKNGCFRRINTHVEEIHWMDASTDPIDIKYPFGIEKIFPTYPKNIIVIAGSPNSGKTAFLLNIVKENMKRHEIHYFSSEMGASELKSRLEKFTEIPLKDWKFYPKERVSDFAPVIVPDAVNIIDYMELLTDIYKVGSYLQEIYSKLTTGIAFIAIQKAFGKELGRGAEFSLEKSRLYLSIENGKIKIIKAKARTNPTINPNGLCKDFKLVDGCLFIDNHDWYREGVEKKS